VKNSRKDGLRFVLPGFPVKTKPLMNKITRKKNGIRNTILILILSTVLSVLLVLGVFVLYPRIIARSISTITFSVARSTAYDTKYGIHPYLLAKVEKVIAEAQSKGIDLRVVRGFRDMETQRKFYAQGRTAPGPIITYAPPGLSYHNHGWAVDVCEYTNGQPNWNSKHWNEIGKIGKKYGLVWGGDWKRLVDKPHLQLPIYDIIKHGIY